MGSAPSQGSPARIMVVDDQASNIQVVGSFLGPLGYDIIPALDGPTALKRVAHRAPDLILLDMLMPGMDGCEVLSRLREHQEWETLPVIVLSAAADKEIIVRAFEAGAMDYVTKPFNKAELISRVQCQLELKEARDQWAHLAREKDEILGMLAHDLKNKLGGLHMTAQLMQRRLANQDDARLRKMSDNLLEASGQLSDFLKEFLANASTDHPLRIQPEPVALQDLLRQGAKSYEEAARRKRLTLHFDLPDETILAQADAAAMRQVIDNLLSNALKFSPPGGRVTLRLTASKEKAMCLVSDQGPGFTKEDRLRLFQRYARLSAKPTANEPSTGLGLSIVHHLVQAMQGELSLESAPGQGATFTVQLPRAANA